MLTSVAALLVSLAFCGTAPDASDTAAESTTRTFDFRGQLDWISAGLGTAYRDTAINNRNEILHLPQLAAQSELRPNVRLIYGSEFEAIARPRLMLQTSKALASGRWLADQSSASVEWIEGYAAWHIDDHLIVAYGLQSFQWGPAELLSPSNRIFHETGFFRDLLYLVRGKNLARVNVTFGDWSLVTLAEVGPNREAPFVAGEPFEPKIELKLEWTGTEGRYAGATCGARQRSHGFFGEYAALPLWAGLSLYADIVHSAGSRAWYPIEANGRALFAQTHADSLQLQTLGIGGARYSFEGGTDIRLEYVFDESGWSKKDLRLAYTAAQDPIFLWPYIDSGFELPGRQLAYASLRIPDLPPNKRIVIQTRYLLSLTDSSGVAFVNATMNATDSVVVFASASATHGAKDGALSRLAKATWAVGAVASW